MRAGVDGFQDGLSANKYQAITGAPAATGRRDLGHLVTLGALVRTGHVKGTRYWLANVHAPATIASTRSYSK
jgi:Fic family protein